MAQEKKPAPKPKVDTSMIDAKARDELRALAQSKVAKERITAAKAQLLEEMETEERRAHGLEEPMEKVLIDLAPFADRLMLDGKVFFNGHEPTVPASQAAVIRDMMQATWRHQSIVDGKSENFYRKQRSQMLSPNGVTSHLLRA